MTLRKTKAHFSFSVLGFLFLSQWASASSAPLTLQDVFQSAQKQSEALQIQQTREAQVQEKWVQNRGMLLPTVQVLSSYQYQDLKSQASLLNSRVNMTQPIFHGFGEWAALRAADADREAQGYLSKQAVLMLYQQVAQAFFSVLAAEKELKNLEELLKLTQQRQAELQQRLKVGRSRKGDLLATQTQEAQLMAQKTGALGDLERARTQLAMLTGVSSDFQISLSGPNPYSVSRVEEFLGQLEERPDVLSGKFAVISAEESQSIARAGHYPGLDFGANYYLKRQSAFWQNVKWDLALSLSIPLFQGGVVSSKVREAAERQREKEWMLAQTRRQAERDIRSAFQAWKASVDQEKNLKQAVDLAERNYQEQTHDYRLGLVTYLELITAMNTLQETRRAYDRTQIQSWNHRAMLEAAAGKVSL